MNQTVKLSSFGVTDVGLKRNHNEDNFFRSDELGLFVVADGMGGHAAGEVASGTAIQTVAEFCRKQDEDPGVTLPFAPEAELSEEGNALINGLRLANQAICNLQVQRPELSGMGTTVAALRIASDVATVAHVGDSRVYRLRGGKLEVLTSDHSWVNEQVLKNIITAEEARNHRYRNVITRALGNRNELEIDVRTDSVEPGDIYLLCSDGLSGMVDDGVLERVLMEHGDGLRTAANRLVALANEGGGIDNITVVLVHCEAPEKA